MGHERGSSHDRQNRRTFPRVHQARRAEGEEHFRAYDVVTEWSGPPRATLEEAERDAAEHNEGCARQGGYGSAIVAERDEGDRLWNAYTGETIWPPHGRSNGAARWR